MMKNDMPPASLPITNESLKTQADAATLLAQTLQKEAYPASYLSELLSFLGMTWSSEPMTLVQQDQVYTVTRALLAQTPVEYIVQKALFCERYFAVTPSVLIPRIDTELLVQHVIEHSPHHSTIIDIGTGSGAIITTLALECDQTNEYIAVDISQQALTVAQKNATTYGVFDKITFYCADVIPLVQQKTVIPQHQSIIIITNPPYISDEDMKKLPTSVKAYEPEIALREQPDFLTKLQSYIELLLSHHKTVTLALEYSNLKGEMIQRFVVNPTGDLQALRLP